MFQRFNVIEIVLLLQYDLLLYFEVVRVQNAISLAFQKQEPVLV